MCTEYYVFGSSTGENSSEMSSSFFFIRKTLRCAFVRDSDSHRNIWDDPNCLKNVLDDDSESLHQIVWLEG